MNQFVVFKCNAFFLLYLMRRFEAVYLSYEEV
jgi:hypothetical protein